jgi:hypothetical protein
MGMGRGGRWCWKTYTGNIGPGDLAEPAGSGCGEDVWLGLGLAVC